MAIGLLLLPYYIFEGKLFLSGDDTRLYYVYPFEWIKQISFFSWFKFSALGLFNPNQFSIPLLLFISFLGFFVHNKVILFYFLFSIVLILGFIYCKKLIGELFDSSRENELEATLGGLMYVLSPILSIGQLQIFLSSVWLIPVLPITCFYFIRYIRTNKFKYVLITAIWLTIFSISLASIPWLLGFILPLMIAIFLSLILFNAKEIFFVFKKTFVFLSVLTFSQFFWLMPFLIQFFTKDQSFGSLALTQKDTFIQTVLATSSGNIIYPLLNLFHRQIAFDFNWHSKNIFLSFYDKIILLNLVYVFILFFGLLFFKRFLYEKEKRIFIIFILGLLLSLFFFTVNIGPLKHLFISLGNITGFAMFRNAFDKFALGYIFIYSIVIGLSLTVLKRGLAKQNFYYYFILSLLFLVIIINALPIKKIINKPLWGTKNIHQTVNIPDEYLLFMAKLKSIPSTANVLSLPFNLGGYTFIKDINSKNTFAGRSPVYLFSGLNDFSGTLSFPQDQSEKLINLLNDRNYIGINNLLQKFNINYVFVTRNIPTEVLKSYLFTPVSIQQQDDELLKSITEKSVLVSSKKNYELFKAKKTNLILNSNNLSFQKINPVKYKLQIKNISKPQYLFFSDSYSNGWKLYLENIPFNSGSKKEIMVKNVTPDLISQHVKNQEISIPSTLDYNINSIKSSVFSAEFTDLIRKLQKNKDKLTTSRVNQYEESLSFFTLGDLAYSFKAPIFDNKHIVIDEYANGWSINPYDIKRKFPKSEYKENSDGSIDAEFTLYYKPQNYFYFGVAISLLTFICCIGYLWHDWRQSNKKLLVS